MVQALDGLKSRVNILKKVEIGGAWKLCPAISEPNGKLKYRVLVGDRIESHPEGSYYLDWRENGQRRREAVRDSRDVRERARLKALEIESQRVGIAAVARPQYLEAAPRLLPTPAPVPVQAQAPGGVLEAFGTFLGKALEDAVKRSSLVWASRSLESQLFQNGIRRLPRWTSG